MGYKKALEVLERGETPSDKAPELGLTTKNVTAEDLRDGTVEALESEPDRDSSGAGQEAMGGDSENEDKKPSPPDEEKGDTPEAELEAPQLTEESAEHPSDKESATEPGEQQIETKEEQATPVKIGEIEAEELAKPEAEAVEGNTDREGDLRESVTDEAAPDSGQFLESKAADELEAGRATLAAATILPLGLLGTKKAWLWAVVLVGLAIAGYFFLKWYFRRDESTSLPKEASETSSGDSIRDFMDNY